MKKAKIISLLIISGMLFSFAACNDKTTDTSESVAVVAADTIVSEEPSSEPTETEQTGFEFTYTNFPVLDGSTSTKPMAVAIKSVLLGISTENADASMEFHKTTLSFNYLIDGTADLLIVAQPSEEAIAMLGDDFIMEPFASEALVFVVNSDNPVDSLTTEQIQKIYTGEITNWKEVGGDDLEIVPIQRNHEAGSQVMMEKLVMSGLEMMDAPIDYFAGGMEELTTLVRSFDGSADAIGYTVYYYAYNMKYAEGLKILKVDGVDPNSDTIKSGEYPFINPYYLVISKDKKEDDPAKILFDWILSPEGQELVDKQGYVPVN